MKATCEEPRVLVCRTVMSAPLIAFLLWIHEVNPMQRWLSCAADELGIRISVEHVVVLADGRNVRAQALFPDLGAERGTLVFDAAEQLDGSRGRIC